MCFNSNKRRYRYAYNFFAFNKYLLIGFWVASVQVANAEVTFDSTGLTLSGDMMITSDRGIIKGSNLLHSFSVFNINLGETATFTGPDTVQNIIARVTGSNSSLIDGTLRSTIADADLFLLNPNGVMFGPGASIDINGSIYLSTAPRLLFEDGSSLIVSDSSNSTLTMAAPSAFGFDAAPVGITFNGVDISSEELDAARGLSIVAGDIALQESSVFLAGSAIDLVAVKGAMDVLIQPELRNLVMGLGDIHQIGGLLESSGDPAGHISLLADNIELSNTAFIFSDTTGASDGLGINVQATATLSLIGGSRITTDALAPGGGGDISITAGSISLSGTNTKISSDSQSLGGNSGGLIINANSLLITDRAQLSSRSASLGDGGDIQIKVANLQLTNRGQISGQAIRQGKGADVTIFATNQVRIDALGAPSNEASGISVSSLNLNFLASESGGDAGDVTIDTPLLQLTNGGRISAESITPNSGAPGAITLNVGELEVSGGSVISTKTASNKDAGTITVNANSLNLTGDASLISSATIRAAAGGDIVLIAQSAFIGNSAEVVVSTDQAGDAGSISMMIEDLVINKGKVNARTLKEGSGGFIRLDVNSLAISNGGSIDTSTAGSGNAGNIILLVSNDVVFNGVNSGITSASSGAGLGGNIEIRATDILLLDSAAIDVNSSGTGFAGNIELVATNRLDVLDGSKIKTNSEISGGGNISVTVNDRVYLANSELTASAKGEGSQDNGGNVTIDPVFLILSNSNIVAQAFAGNGGIIELHADNFISDTRSFIDATSELGNDGEVRIVSPENSVTGVVGVLNADFGNENELLRDSCASRALADRSSLVVREKKQVLSAPGDLVTMIIESAVFTDNCLVVAR